jgi:hypothetical protein
LANLNARTYRPSLAVTKENCANNHANPQFSAMAFTSGQNPVGTGANRIGGNGVLSFIRSIARTIHNEDNEPPNPQTEHMSGSGAKVQQPAEDLTDSLRDTR